MCTACSAQSTSLATLVLTGAPPEAHTVNGNRHAAISAVHSNQDEVSCLTHASLSRIQHLYIPSVGNNIVIVRGCASPHLRNAEITEVDFLALEDINGVQTKGLYMIHKCQI